MTDQQPTPAASATDQVQACPFVDPVECQECRAIMERADTEKSDRQVAWQTYDHPAEWIHTCPECGADEPTYDVPAACDGCDGTKCCEGIGD